VHACIKEGCGWETLTDEQPSKTAGAEEAPVVAKA